MSDEITIVGDYDDYAQAQADFVKAHAAISNPKKNANNPAFRSQYANLEECLAVTRPILAEHKLALVQIPVSSDMQQGVETQLWHENGAVLDFGSFTVPLTKQDAQGAGSAITYCRRYAINAIFGLAQEDDDGNAASKPEVRKEEKPTKPPSKAIKASIVGLMDKLGYGPDDMRVVTEALFGSPLGFSELSDKQAQALALELGKLADAAPEKATEMTLEEAAASLVGS